MLTGAIVVTVWVMIVVLVVVVGLVIVVIVVAVTISVSVVVGVTRMEVVAWTLPAIQLISKGSFRSNRNPTLKVFLYQRRRGIYLLTSWFW